MPKISVIVPMYNAENYIKLAINSLLNQTFRDFEAILIDDCSTDKTLKIAKKIKDSRIKIIENNKNLGMPGLVRNVGLEAARGKYIYFLDNDDVMLPNALEIFFNAAEQNNADVVSTITAIHAADSNFKSVNNIKIRQITVGKLDSVSSDLKTRIFEEILLRHMHCAVWLSFYNGDFLKSRGGGIKFPDCVGEDLFWQFDVVCATEKIIKIDKPVYIWRPNEASASHSMERLRKDVEAVLALTKYVEQKLAHIDDYRFVSEVARFMSTDLLLNYTLQFLMNDFENTLNIIEQVIDKVYEKDSLFVKNIIKNYLVEYLNMRKINEENQKLKIQLKSVKNNLDELVNIV